MLTINKTLYMGAAIGAVILLQACSQSAPTAAQQSNSAQATSNGVSDQSIDPTAAPLDGQTADALTAPNAGNNSGFAPGESLAFEWSANGFTQLPAQYQWTGSGKRDADFQPNFSLSVPQTDDGVWSSSCKSNGLIETQLYLNPPPNMKNNRTVFKFETDKSTRTLSYNVQYVADGMMDGFRLVQYPNDQMFQEMKAGTWAYMQMGEGADAVKLRVSLANASRSLNAFLPACSPNASQAKARPAPPLPPAPSTRTAAIRYNCEDGRTAMATYLGNDTDNPIVRLEIGGKVMLMPQGVSGSGARYESTPGSTGGKKYVWHNKGTGSLFIESDANDTDGASETIVSCKEP